MITRRISLLPLLILITLPSAPAEAAGAVVLAWAPVVATEPALYDVYGIHDGVATHLGSTTQTAYLAPSGFSAYAVKYTLDGVEREVGVLCVEVETEDGINVILEPHCA